jgi:hypothetical protein
MPEKGFAFHRRTGPQTPQGRSRNPNGRPSHLQRAAESIHDALDRLGDVPATGQQLIVLADVYALLDRAAADVDKAAETAAHR